MGKNDTSNFLYTYDFCKHVIYIEKLDQLEWGGE